MVFTYRNPCWSSYTRMALIFCYLPRKYQSLTGQEDCYLSLKGIFFSTLLTHSLKHKPPNSKSGNKGIIWVHCQPIFKDLFKFDRGGKTRTTVLLLQKMGNKICTKEVTWISGFLLVILILRGFKIFPHEGSD